MSTFRHLTVCLFQKIPKEIPFCLLCLLFRWKPLCYVISTLELDSDDQVWETSECSSVATDYKVEIIRKAFAILTPSWQELGSKLKILSTFRIQLQEDLPYVETWLRCFLQLLNVQSHTSAPAFLFDHRLVCDHSGMGKGNEDICHVALNMSLWVFSDEG